MTIPRVPRTGTRMQPILLPPNQPPARFYQGGRGISAFRGIDGYEKHTPEDWVGSTTSVRGRAPEGLTQLPDGRLLVDAVRDDPGAWLGPAHVRTFGADTRLLVKLLDAGQRLPVHAHPDTAFANTHLAAAHGKAEAWFMLSAGTVHIGLTRNTTVAELHDLVVGQDAHALLGMLHEIHVEPGDSVMVPPGTLHAIGADVLLAEVQEPEDLSILLEWQEFALDGARDGHLDLGFELALTAVDTDECTPARVESLVRRGTTSGRLLPQSADPYFRLDRVVDVGHFAAGFGILIVLDGGARLTCGGGLTEEVAGVSTLLIPYGAGDIRIEGSAHLARPPRP